jgi:5-methylcytosine-specific restriction endonuclease McrA
MDTLLLNADYRPLDVLTWVDALLLVFRGKARIVVEGTREVRSPSLTYYVPHVLVLKVYRKHQAAVKFSRHNVYARDNYQCQYCGKGVYTDGLSLSSLTFDHVMPISRGGPTTWLNIVTSCGKCNRTKANRLPSEAGMPLLNAPHVPRGMNPLTFRLKGRRVPEVWHTYLGRA